MSVERISPSREPPTQINGSTGARKKRKVEEVQDSILAPETELGTPHADLWFEEGNVIIAAVGKSFKVHSGVLGRHSDVFRAVLSIPALQALPEQYDGCPIFRVPDNGDHLQEVLLIMYDGAKRCSHLFTRVSAIEQPNVTSSLTH